MCSIDNSLIFNFFPKFNCALLIILQKIWNQIPQKKILKKFQNAIALYRNPTTFNFPENTFGILLAVYDPHRVWGSENFILSLKTIPNSPNLEITNSLKIPYEITCLKTLFSESDMKDSESLGLFYKLTEWRHVVAVGCEKTNCYLAALNPISSESSDVVTITDNPRNFINLMSAYTSECEGVFRYSQEDGIYKDYPAEDVFVSALSLMPRSRTLLVGFSMGGLLAASLSSSNQMMLLELRHERLIRSIAPTEPEDDPDKFEYFITAVELVFFFFFLWKSVFTVGWIFRKNLKNFQKNFFFLIFASKIRKFKFFQNFLNVELFKNNFIWLFVSRPRKLEFWKKKFSVIFEQFNFCWITVESTEIKKFFFLWVTVVSKKF